MNTEIMDKWSTRIQTEVLRVLLEHSDGTFPISLFKIAKSLGIKIINREDAGELLALIAPGRSFEDMPVFSVELREQFVVIIDMSYGDAAIRRLMLAHEIGHFVLGYPEKEEHAIIMKMYRAVFQRSPAELAFDMFAIGLLMPQGILKTAGITSIYDITRLCNVSPRLAFVSSASIGQSPRVRSTLERRVYEKFSASIEQYKLRGRGFVPKYVPAFITDISEEITY